jgi:peptidoglycan/LPS O-acetylase OafA/YrhL
MEKSRNSTIDVLRCAASYTVILIHTKIFQSSAEYYHGWLHDFFTVLFKLFQSIHVAVPFFFVTSGYFFGKTLKKGEPLKSAWWRYAERIIRLFLVWSTVYYFIPLSWLDLVIQYGFLKTFYWHLIDLSKTFQEAISHPLSTILQGPTPHLWFLTALFLGITILSGFIAIKKEKYVFILGAVLYIVSLLGTTYAELPIIGFNSPLVTRHGPYTSVLFVSIGWWLAQQPRYSMKTAWLLFGVGSILMTTGSLWLSWHNHGSIIYDYLLSAVPLAAGLFMLALLYPHIGESTPLPDWGRMNLGVYLGHMMVMDTFKTFKVFFHPLLWDLINPPMVFLLTVGLTIFLQRNAITKRIFL